MSERFMRTQLLYGEEAMKRFASARVAVFGVGGVGGYVVEALARSGIGALDLIDNDTVCESNINRQIIATDKTVGQYKVDAARDRVKDIAPDCVVRTHRVFFLPETEGDFPFDQFRFHMIPPFYDFIPCHESFCMHPEARKQADIRTGRAFRGSDARYPPGYSGIPRLWLFPSHEAYRR